MNFGYKKDWGDAYLRGADGLGKTIVPSGLGEFRSAGHNSVLLDSTRDHIIAQPKAKLTEKRYRIRQLGK